MANPLDYGVFGGFLPDVVVLSVWVSVVVPPGVVVVVLVSFFASSLHPKGANKLSPHTAA